MTYRNWFLSLSRDHEDDDDGDEDDPWSRRRKKKRLDFLPIAFFKTFLNFVVR